MIVRFRAGGFRRCATAERYERARAASPETYACAEARFAELAVVAIEAGEKRLPTARIFEQVNREAERQGGSPDTLLPILFQAPPASCPPATRPDGRSGPAAGHMKQ